MIKRLQKKHYKILGGTKYFIECSNITSEPESIIPDEILKNKDNVSIIKAVIDYTKHVKRNKHIVIKIAHKDKTNKKEYQIGETLKNIPGFIKYICLFNCFDAHNIGDNDNYVLIMPYINNNSMRNYKWSLENTHILKSLLKQCIVSLMYAYLEHGFLHNDLHLDNIMFKKTKVHSIKHRDLEIETNGYKIIIMDFDLSFIGVNRDEGIEYYWSNLIKLFSRIDCDLNQFIMPLNNNFISSFINKAKIENYDPKKTVELLDLIDKLEFRLPKTLTVPTYNPDV